ncbi:MAG: hypothetical protein ACR2N2_00620 [Acidimicrobiia bacterium]
MTNRRAIWWVDVGMAGFVAVFIAIVMFADDAIFNLSMTIFIAALLVWAFVAEVAARNLELNQTEEQAAVRTAHHGTPIHH